MTEWFGHFWDFLKLSLVIADAVTNLYEMAPETMTQFRWCAQEKGTFES